jgi:hypothetical protein
MLALTRLITAFRDGSRTFLKVQASCRLTRTGAEDTPDPDG